MAQDSANYDSNRARQSSRFREILRLSATVDKVDVAREILLEWLESQAETDLPEAAWKGREFHHEAGNRSFTAMRAEAEAQDTWALRCTEPDAEGADREWTTEVAIRVRPGGSPQFSVRSLVKSDELKLRIQPTVPRFMEHIAGECGMQQCGKKAEKSPWIVASEYDAGDLAEFLADPKRQIPAFVLTVPEESDDPNEPLLDPVPLQADTLGIAKVIVLPADFTWALTNRFGKRLSVYRGAMRVYLPGFSEHADPEGGHDLFMPHRMDTPENAAKLGSLLRWMAARESLRRLRLDHDVIPFASVLIPAMDIETARLAESKAKESERLAATEKHLSILRQELQRSLLVQQWLGEQNRILESRMREAESKVRGSHGRRGPSDRAPRDRPRPRYQQQAYGRQPDPYDRDRDADSFRSEPSRYPRDEGGYRHPRDEGGYRPRGGPSPHRGGGRSGGGRQGGGWDRRGH